MRSTRTQRPKALLLAAIFILMLGSTPAPASEPGGRCEAALALCLAQAMSDPLIFVPYSIFCLEGYLFCKKYLEN